MDRAKLVEKLRGRFLGFIECDDLQAFIAYKDGENIMFQQSHESPVARRAADRKRIEELEAEVTRLKGQFDSSENHYGKDCPEGKVQVEFVGCSPRDRINEYGWKPCNHAFMDIYVDGHRFSIRIGSFDSARGNKRRGLHIIGPIGMGVDQHSLNACDLTVVDDGLGNTLRARKALTQEPSPDANS